MDLGPRISSQEFEEEREVIHSRIIDGGPYRNYDGVFVATTELIARYVAFVALEKEVRAAQQLPEIAAIEIDLAA